MKFSSIPFLAFVILLGCHEKEQVKPSSLAQSYGLGNNLTQSVSNDKSYDWYLDQVNTGIYSRINCGPTSVTMAIKWANQSFASTPEDARTKYRPEGGWWFTSDIISYLNDNSINNSTIPLSTISVLKNELDYGNILILCLDMFYVRPQSTPSYHVDKFYDTSTKNWGHFIVIKGYKVVDNQVFYEAYDPYSFGDSYVDNSLKGKDRYYRSADLDAATGIWWDFAIVIPKGSGGSAIKAHPNAVNPARIQHKSGQ